MARNEALAFIDDDVLVHSGWLDSLWHELCRCDEGTAITGMVRNLESTDGKTFAPSTRMDTEVIEYAMSVRRDVLYTGNMAVFASVFRIAGNFDERLGPGTRFPAAEDNDLGLRLLRSGFKIRYVPNAVVDHVAWRSISEHRKMQWGYGRGQGAFYAKHLTARDGVLWRRIASDLVRNTARGVRGFWKAEGRGHFWFGAGLIAGYAQWTYEHRLRRA
jgi:GT2 family glycosyltransferase